MSGGTASSVQSPSLTQLPPWFSTQQAGNANTINQQLPQYNTYAQYLPLAQETFANLYNNPYAALAQKGAATAGGMAQKGAVNQFNVGGGLESLGAGTLPAWASTVMNTAMDPQGALYKYLQNQNMQQTDANLAAAGVATTPYGAGVADQSNQQFNMNWENQQLARQLAGLQGATSADVAGANIAQTGAGLQAQAPIQYMYGAGLPYGTYNTTVGNQFNALTGLGGYGQQSATIPQQQIQNFDNLIRLAMSGDQNALNLMQLQLGQNQANWNQLAGLGSGVGSLFGGLGPFGALGPFSGLFGGGAGAGGGGGATALGGLLL